MKRPFNPWPWVPPAILLLVVIANAFLIYLAVTVDDPLVLEAQDASGVSTQDE